MLRKIMLVAGAAALIPLTAACSKNDAGADAAKQASTASGSLAQQLGKAGGHARVAKALDDTGLGGIFAGKDSYTLLAPDDRSFAGLDKDGQAALEGKDGRAAMAALLRDHILPGTVTPKDIGAAIDAAKDGKVAMRTMGDGEIVFTRADGGIVATAADGAKARLGTEPIIAGASAAIPIDGLLKKG